jgi:6-phosphogluconolactonase
MAPDLSRLEPGINGCTPVIVPPSDYVETAAQLVARALDEAGRRPGRISLALSGGRGPRPIYEKLAGIPGLPWSRTVIYFADERAVPPDDVESNHRLVRESLLGHLTETPAAVHRMEGERRDLEAAAGDYERILPSALDVLLLGMGEDGHTASLFPRHPATREEQRLVLAVDGPVEPRRRITITPPVVRRARVRIMLVAGEKKAAAVALACEGSYDPVECPAQLAREGLWILDEPAASKLRSRIS